MEPARRRAHPALIAISALPIPILVLGTDLCARGRHLPECGAPTYAAGALLSALVWVLGLEAARHPQRAVRAAATAFLGFTAAFGLGLQAAVQHVTHAYLGRRALLLAAGAATEHVQALAELAFLQIADEAIDARDRFSRRR